MTDPEGHRRHGWWRVEEVDPPNRLRFQDGFGDEDGNPSDEMAPGTAIVTLTESHGRTTMAIESHFTSREDMEKLLKMGQGRGMKEAMGQIDGLLVGRRARTGAGHHASGRARGGAVRVAAAF